MRFSATLTKIMLEKLQIYKETYRLVDLLYKVMPQMPKMHRYVIGSRILEKGLDLFTWISLANKTFDKAERIKYLDSFLCSFEQLRALLRICNDNGLLKLSTVTNLQVLIISISKQLNGWRNATSRA